MFETYLASSEMVFFWEGESIDKSMMFSDFEATLDGYVGLLAYANEEKRAAYVQLDDALRVSGVVLFTIGFDESGFAERSWNLPLRLLAFSAKGLLSTPSKDKHDMALELAAEWLEDSLAMLDRARDSIQEKFPELDVTSEIGSGAGWSGAVDSLKWKKGDLMLMASAPDRKSVV